MGKPASIQMLGRQIGSELLVSRPLLLQSD